MRAALDSLYRASGALAAVFLVAICATVLVQVAFNAMDVVSVAFGGQAIGLVLPSYSEFTGYFLAASTFFAGAYTLNAGAHIRVGLVIEHLPGGARRVAELWCAGAGAVFAVYFTWWSALLTVESWEFNDVSPGIVPVPTWLPQSSMTLGLAILTLALLDRFHRALTGQPVGPDAGEP